MAVPLNSSHHRRLRQIWRSAGWPCQDMLEVELLGAEIPPQCGVMFAADTALHVARPAPKRPLRMSFGLWMALARAAPLANGHDQDSQPELGEIADAAPAEPGAAAL